MAKKKKNIDYLVPLSGIPAQQSTGTGDFLRFIANKGGRVGSRAAQSGAGTATVYTCPINKVAYLLSCNYYWRATGNAQLTRMLINSDVILEMDSTNVVDDHEVITLAFPIPVRLLAGDSIKISCGGANTTVQAAVLVYEVDILEDNLQKQSNF